MIRTILLASSATLAAVAIAASLFLNSTLEMFGLTTTSIETLQQLRSSQQVVDKMKQRHAEKKLSTSKKLTKRASQRVASATVAAATVGTVAVAVTMISLEIADYCEEKKSLQEDADILYGTDTQFDLKQCAEEGMQDSKAILLDLKSSSVEAVSGVFRETSDNGSDTWTSVKQVTDQALQSMGEAATDMLDNVRSWLKHR